MMTRFLFLALVAALVVGRAFNPDLLTRINNFSIKKEQSLIPTIVGDTAVFKKLTEKLAEKNTAASPEKLYLSLDRTQFEPGDDLWFTAFLRNADDLAPARQSQIVHLELVMPNGSVAATKTLAAPDGSAAGDFHFQENWPGGIFKIRAWTNWMRNQRDTFEREITVQKVVLPNLRLKLEFERKGLGAGDIAIARFDAQTLENQPLANRNFKFTTSLGGEKLSDGEAKTDVAGRAFVRFELPQKLETTDGLLNILIENDGKTEAISRPIPIVLNKIDLQFFPEGGDLVVGLPSRVAFKAVNEFGKPADVSGSIFEKNGQKVADFESYHDGMGAFELIPQAGKTYEARLTKPFSDSKIVDLPAAQAVGFGLRLQKRDEKSLTFQISASRPSKAFLVGVSRDKLFFFNELALKNHEKEIVVSTENLPIGIARFTLLDENLVEQAERLAFVNREKSLQIDIKTDREKYLPRERVKMSIAVRDAAGRPVEGQFALAVADDAQLTFADNKQGHILSSLLLEQDVRGKIEEPNFYFDPTEPKSAQALDFLLMTQGWRRFSWTKIMDDEPLVFQNQRERLSLGGQLFKHENQVPAAGKTIACWPVGPSVETDKEGHFLFQNVDFQQVTHLKIGKTQFIPISNYGENFKLVMDSDGTTAPLILKSKPSDDGKTWLNGTVSSKDGPEFASTVKVSKNGQIVKGAVTDFDGKYAIELPSAGKFEVEFSNVGFQTERFVNVEILKGKSHELNGNLEERNSSSCEVVVKAWKAPMIQVDNESQGATVTAEQIHNLPTTSKNKVISIPTGVQSVEGQDVMMRGSRDVAPNYYVDGIRVSNKNLPPAQDIEQLDVVVGGLEARFENAELDEVVVRKKEDREADDWQAARSKVRMDFAKQMPQKPAPQPSVWPQNRVHFDRARQFYTPFYVKNEAATAPRTDFRSTIYWNPSVRTDKNGRATVEFSTNDALTTFRATIEGLSNSGKIGRAEARFFTQKPVALAASLPTNVLSGDVVRLPISLKNNTSETVVGSFSMTAPSHFQLKNELPKTVELAAGEVKILTAEMEVGTTQSVENQPLSFAFKTQNGFSDDVKRAIKTGNRGFPVTQIFSGEAMQNAVSLSLMEPIDGSVSLKLTAYPSTLNDVLKGMERMLNQPSGCFEQVSSSNYPNLLVLDFLKKTGALRPEIEARANQFLADGYQKLTAYECPSGGFDWWGRNPAHEGLTAYGLLEFEDMSHVFKVDNSLIDRTLTWILSRRDGQGGWLRRPDYLHTWNGSQLDAYLAWAVCEAGFGKQFLKEINHAFELATASNDFYQLALLANALTILNDVPRANPLIIKLLAAQNADGSWQGATASIMGSTGLCLKIETTALAALALMKTGISEDGRQSSEVVRATRLAMDFLKKSKTETGFGSTQSTVLAMRALVESATRISQAVSDGRLVVLVDGEKVAEENFSSSQLNNLEINGLARFFKNKTPRIEVFFEGTKTPLPFDLELKYAARQPRNSADCPISMTTVLEKTTARVGETVRLTAVLKNESAQPQASPMLVVGIPGGLTLQAWQLKKLVDEHRCAFYELWNGYAVFHFESVGAGERLEIPLDLRADVAGRWEAPASQAFLYYSNDLRVFAKPDLIELEK